MKRLWVLLLLPLGLVLLPPAAHADCGTPELPVIGCPLPGPTPSETPTPAETTQPSPTPPGVTSEPTPAESGETVTVVHTDPPPPGAVLVPDIPLGGGPVVGPTPAPTPAPTVPVVVAGSASAPAAVTVSPLSGVVASSFGIVVFGLIVLALLLSFLAGLRPAAPAHPPYGGNAMRNRARLWTGLGVLAAAAVVGGVGWYRVSGEPLLNRQIPFLASAGLVVVLLSALGGSLIVAEQLRGDQNRIGELEEAVRALTEALAPAIERAPRVEEPPTEVLVRGRGRSRRASAGST